MDRMGVAFNRTGEGHLDFRRFGGTLYNRTAFAGATTGQQLVYALDEQVRRNIHDGNATVLEWHEYLGAAIDSDGICRGAVIHDLKTDEIYTLRADAVVLATGGPGQVYGRSTNSESILEQQQPPLIYREPNMRMENLSRFTPPLFPDRTN